MVTPMTVRRWSNKNLLKTRTTPGGHRRFLRSDVEAFAEQRGMELPPNTDTRKKILIVDDDDFVANYIAEILSDPKYDVISRVCSNGFEAGLEVKSFHPDVIVMDLMMPNMSGIDVCKILKNNPATKGVRIIGVTGYYSDNNVSDFIRAGAELCLKKPIDPKSLLESLGLDSSEF